MRATSRLSSPAWFAQPKYTSSTSLGRHAGALGEGAQGVGAEVVRAHRAERASVAPDRGAHRADDPGLVRSSVAHGGE